MAHGLYILIEWVILLLVGVAACQLVGYWVVGVVVGCVVFGILCAFSAFRGTDVPRNAETAQEIPGSLEGMVLIPSLSACCYLHLVRVVWSYTCWSFICGGIVLLHC